MRLSRRDALAALAVLGTASAGCAKRVPAAGDTDSLETYLAVAEVVYPSEVSGIETFLESFLPARLDREDHGAAMRETVAELEELAQEWYDDSVAGLSASDRERLLHEVGADTAEENPDGVLAERVRFYMVNELLLALYSSPTGGELVGLENPQGYAGGTDSYQRGPQR